MYLKWNEDVVGVINQDYSVDFIAEQANDIVRLYLNDMPGWDSLKFESFLAERIVSRERRDIEKILFRCGLSSYNVFEMSKITRAINAKDLFWIAQSKEERLQDVVTEVFDSVFNQKIDMVGDSVNTPEGCNIKRYGVHGGNYGIFKNRINPLTTDAESEVAVYLLAKEMGIDCCPAFRIDENTVFSAFQYDFAKEYIVHFRRLFEGGAARSENEYLNLLGVRPQYKNDYIKMLTLDFITRQDDRHLSNFAVKIRQDGKESFYPLYDNGRSLFYEDTENLVSKACGDIEGYATTFGYSGTYFDYLCDLSKQDSKFSDFINLNIGRERIGEILKTAGFMGYRYDGAMEWIEKSIEKVKELERKKSFSFELKMQNTMPKEQKELTR